MATNIVSKQISIKAQPEAVWDALTNPAKTKQYFFHCAVFSDWKVDSSIIFKGRMLFIIPISMQGTILAIEPGKLLKYELNNKGGSRSVVTDTLTYANGATTLAITDDVGSGAGAGKRYQRSVKGWDKIMAGLKALVEKEPA